MKHSPCKPKGLNPALPDPAALRAMHGAGDPNARVHGHHLCKLKVSPDRSAPVSPEEHMLLLPVTYPEALTREDKHPDIMWLCFPVHACTLTPGYTGVESCVPVSTDGANK